MALGLIMIGQPWVRVFFVAGFPVTFLSIVAYNIFSRRDVE
jgi:hypothetical protein